MLNLEDLKWIATTATDLNSIVQQISRYTDLARKDKGEHNHLDLLAERAEIASKTAQELFDGVTSRILDAASAKSKAKTTIPFAVVPPPQPVSLKTDLQPSPGRRQPRPSATETTSAVLGIASLARVKNAQGHREYILVIEDEPEVAELAADMLAAEGYKVIIALDGFEALKIYRGAADQIRLVILDFFLPVMDGDAIFDELRSINPDVDVVLSSGFAEQTKIASMLDRGLRGFIPKPYTQERLLEQVRSALDIARSAAR